MEPAILFAGDISAYVLWAVTLDGTAENLGEVIVDEKSASGSAQYSTTKRVLALMMTAEPYATTARPTELVLFKSGEVQAKLIQNTPFTFKGFSTDSKPALDSIAGAETVTAPVYKESAAIGQVGGVLSPITPRWPQKRLSREEPRPALFQE